ncbi:MAG: hypothetical protein ACYS0I_08395 [Planctomycetota bacterium]
MSENHRDLRNHSEQSKRYFVIIDWRDEIKHSFFSGRARWLFTLLATANVLFLLLTPTGEWLFAVGVFTLLIYLVLGIQNWTAHLRSAAKHNEYSPDRAHDAD